MMKVMPEKESNSYHDDESDAGKKNQILTLMMKVMLGQKSNSYHDAELRMKTFYRINCFQ